MLVDLNLQNKMIMVIGGGKESQKRVSSLLKQDCEILVMSERTSPGIERLAETGRIRLRRERVTGSEFISKFKPDVIITTTDDAKLNQEIVNAAKKRRIIVYSSDNPAESDFSNPAVIDFENTVQIAVFTGGQSPAMAKKIKSKAEKLFKEIITRQDILQIKIQKFARKEAKSRIFDQSRRRDALRAIMDDSGIDQLIKDGHIGKAEKRASSILEDWV